jgi:signal transduction histidine kinase
MRKIYFLFCTLLSILFFAQNNSSEKDSLAFMKYYKECNASSGDTAKFQQMLPKLRKLSDDINQPYSLGRVTYLIARHYMLIGQYDSSNLYLKQAFKTFNYIPALNSLQAKCYAGLAQNYINKGDNKTAIEMLLAYLDFAKKYKLIKLETDAYSRLGNLLDLNGQSLKAIQYLKMGIEVAKRNQYNEELADIYNMMGTAYYSLYVDDSTYSKKSLQLVDTSIYYFNNSIQICNEIKDSIGLSRTYNNMMGAYEYKKEYDKSLFCIQQSLAITKSFGEERDWTEPYSNLALAYFNLKKFDLARKTLDTAIALAKKYNIQESLLTCYNLQMQIAKANGDFKSAYEWLNAKTHLNDSIYGTETTNKISELEIQYQTKEKENTIANQKLKLEQRNKTILLISIVALLLAIAAWLYYKSFKSKNELAFQQQQQRASLMVIESEQTERMRIARELHDGIGQKLTVLKMYASAEKEKNEKQLDLLDNTIQEVREISHKMIPEILSLGLIAAVRDLCNKVNIGGTIECSFVCDEPSNDLKLAENINLSIYRIIQEIINNMLKHANAKHIDVKFVSTGNNLQITVNDDGQGFDVKKIKQSSGIGWSNIFTRASIIKAAVDVNSSDKGTNITLNLNI